jgi:hypothetical protein
VKAINLLDLSLFLWICCFQGSSWLLDLTAINYTDALPVPFLAVEAKLVSIVGSEIHDFIQTTDNAALSDKDEDGEHAPLILSTLDLSHWSSIVLVSTQENGIENLKRIWHAYEEQIRCYQLACVIP